MIVYNVTLKVDWNIAEEWLKWMQDVYIPAILATGFFEKHQLVKLLETDDADGSTYAVQYYATSLNECNNYINKHAHSFSKSLHARWGDKCIAFTTLMEVVS